MDFYEILLERIKLSNNKKTILFLGDSITERWDNNIFNIDFEKFNTIKLSKDGFRTENIIKLLDYEKIKTINPECIVILIGINNVWFNTSKNTCDDIKKIIDILISFFPFTKIILRGLLPFGKYKNEDTRIYSNEVNNTISTYNNDNNIFYIDNSDIFLDNNGSIIDELMPDNLHLSLKGYEKLSQHLTPFINKIIYLN